MNWISYDPIRTRGFPDTRYLKPNHFFRDISLVSEASLVLFPEPWQANLLTLALGKPIFPSHAAYLLGQDKVEMTRAFQSIAPAHVPLTVITSKTGAGVEEALDVMVFPFVAKLPNSARGEGVMLIETRRDFETYCSQTDVIYVQEYLEIDRDIRVVVVGGEVIGAYWRLQSRDGFHNNVARGGVAELSPVPDAAIELVLRTARRLGIDYAGFDVAMVGDWPMLFEFNRRFGNQGLPGGDEYLRARTLEYVSRLAPPETPDDDREPPLWPRAA